jgi:predicted MFS family arabinose efflux permease
VVPLITQAVIANYGWRAAYVSLGAIALVGFPLTAMLLRNRPHEEAASDTFATGSSVRVALSGSIFWMLAVIIALSAFGANGLISHLAAMLSERGISGSSAAATLSMLGATGIAGRLLTGLLLDRFFAPYVSALMLLVSAAGMGILATASTGGVALAGAALLGFGLGSEADVTPYLISRYFGRKHFAALYGLSWTAYAVGGATGPVVIGHLYDRAGSYLPVFIVGLALTCLIGAALSLFLPRYPAIEAYPASEALTAAQPLMEN